MTWNLSLRASSSPVAPLPPLREGGVNSNFDSTSLSGKRGTGKGPGALRADGLLAMALLLGLSLQVSSAFAGQDTGPHSSKPRTDLPIAVVPADGERSAWGEDWGSLSLDQSNLKPEPPLLGEKDEFPEFTRELIQVRWRPNDPIDLYVIRPRSVEKPPVILYLYSYPSETQRFLDDSYCTRVTKDGFAAIGFVSAFTGHRYHDRPMRRWFVSELQEALVSSVHDVHMILNYLSSRGDLDMSRVGMFGQGSGASIAILAAAAGAQIQVLDLLDPWGDWPDWMAKSPLIPEVERGDYLKPEFLNRVAPLDPVQWLPRLGSQHVRLQHVMDTTITPPVCKQRLESVAPGSVKVVRYAGMHALYSASTGGRLFDWIKFQLGEQPKP